MYKKTILVCLLLILFVWHSPNSYFIAKVAAAQPIIELRLLETTDLHADLINYDYYLSRENNRIGLVKTATLIRKARKEVKNSLLFDVGDHLKGNPLGEYLARIRGIHKGKIHPVYRAFNHLNYDAIAIGNHEFNYGLKFLNAALRGANMPVINANVISLKTNTPYFNPYVILKRKFTDLNGDAHELKIGVIGLMPPQIMKWDKTNLEGRVFPKPIVDAANEYVPIMKTEGADIIIALAHTGISAEAYSPDTENAVYYLTKIPGIDAILAGHSHSIFPGPAYQKLPNTNLETGEIRGKPVVMAGAFGSHLGIIDLKIKQMAGKWKVVNGISHVRPIADDDGKSLVKTDKLLFQLLRSEHQETVNTIRKLGF
ncbi:metallophosphoesterase [Neobacillus niacini]|uniref:metallophosphoesterase n=1 Tax=Neobacillus niacini TaxID=86668 RepID=UPI0021CB4ECA|nr:metallophosphoesterase [Neobacillus niacini]MCM3767284.1 metallophosphoesterase [Neobacillus niacini]